jgi:transposase-like protein
MVGNSFVDELLLLAVLWQVVVSYGTWKRGHARKPLRTPQSQRVPKTPKPSVGLTKKPPCATCERSLAHRDLPLLSPPPVLAATRGGTVTNQSFSGTMASYDNLARRKRMVYVPVQCPHCQSTAVIKAGKQVNGSQRYQCQNGQCVRRIFLLQYQDRGRAPEVRSQVVEMALNGSGVRDTARVLHISPTTVIAILKKLPL